MVSAAVRFGDGRMRGLLLVLLCVSHASASCGIQKTNVMETSEEGLVNDKEFPWVVSLQDSQYTHLAFGSILSEFWIISIASVFQNRKDVIVIVGIAKMDAKVIAHEEYPVNTIIIHEDFDNETMTNNIALLKTDTAIEFNNLIQPICFLGRKLNMPPALRNCWVAGWNPTTATGNHMTMSILRKISVKDINMCPLHKIKKTGCGNHIEQETDAVCLGDPGNPMMCQLQQVNMWVLRGILSHGGEKCPGLFLYIKVEDYSDWIMSKTKKTSRPLSSFHHWEESFPFSSYSSHIIVTPRKHSGLGQGEWSQAYVQEQEKITLHTWPYSSRESPDLGEKGLTELGKSSVAAVQPIYYDYHGGEARDGGRPISGQKRLRQPQEITLFFFVLLFFCNGI
ncbi:LOW QUALITY PROTEIN: inactive serine protease 54 [Ailuropoda melanoleuca]|uniref:LOW QUALITY PROTEIN: inactive serine protease 54 n=1 Tax=Ailuropoda melanoleuca TaxID=9646 RepID=UPI000947AF73|nr:LOW QUALITY PROTEIN: inactive serine protease 54 [Ailuropoda melanoleuca]